jgi:hypothetical protein
MTMRILNLTQHAATPEQIKAGVFEPSADDKEVIRSLLTFNLLPGPWDFRIRARRLAEIVLAAGFNRAMIGGAPYLMPALVAELKRCSIEPLAAYSLRESVEQTLADGAVEKTMVFRHKGFVVM